MVPNALSTTNISEQQRNGGWTPFVTADVFRIRYYVNGTSTYFHKDLSEVPAAASLTNLTQNTTYKWQVSSICNGVSSGYGSVATFTTTNNPTPVRPTLRSRNFERGEHQRYRELDQPGDRRHIPYSLFSERH